MKNVAKIEIVVHDPYSNALCKGRTTRQAERQNTWRKTNTNVNIEIDSRHKYKYKHKHKHSDRQIVLLPLSPFARGGSRERRAVSRSRGGGLTSGSLVAATLAVQLVMVQLLCW